MSAPTDAADDLALRRVMLSTGGVGYFEYETTVAGDAALSVVVRMDQVDDVLKSIVVYDDTGGVGTISLPGREALEHVFRDLPFDPDDLTSPVRLLRAVVGAEVATTGARALTGRLLAVVPEDTVVGDGNATVTQHRLSLMTEDGLRQLILENVESLRFLDPTLDTQIRDAMAAVAEHRQQDRRRLTITTRGATERSVRVGYVVEAPLWKAAYRLTLAAGDTDAGLVQGWAVLENLSGEAWQDVDLTVVSGNPVTFRQALYNAYFVDRPDVPVEVLGRILPKRDDGALPTLPQIMATVAAAPRPGVRARGLPVVTADGTEAFMAEAAPGQAMAAARPAELAAAVSQEATTQVTFRYPELVTLANGSSLLMPIIAGPLPAERLALYQPSTHPKHPLAAVRLTNDSASGLPPGVLTLYEQSADGPANFVGDAQLGVFPAGEERLLSFALDQRVRIDRDSRADRALTQATIADGVLRLVRTERQVTVYTIQGAARADRTVLIEHPRRADWTLVAPADPDSMTDTAYRLRTGVPAGGTVHLEAVMERLVTDRYRLFDVSDQRLDLLVDGERLPPALVEALQRAAALRRAVSEQETRLADLQAQRNRLIDDQGRLRENLQAVPRDSDLFRRYLERLGAAEDRLDTLAGQRVKTQNALDDARADLADFIRSLDV